MRQWAIDAAYLLCKRLHFLIIAYFKTRMLLLLVLQLFHSAYRAYTRH